MKLIVLFCLTLICASCSLRWPLTETSTEIDPILKDYKEFENQDYIEQFKVLNDFYVRNPDIKTINLTNRYSRYLNKVLHRVLANNELFFKRVRGRFKFRVIDDQKPFYFSLPDKTIYLSLGLLDKYVKSENLIYCIVTYELIKLEKMLYRKTVIYPKGIIGTSKLLSMVRIKTENKIEIHKWAFYLLKRSGITSDNYLSWLQIQNRNSLDFRLMMGDVNSISQEEAMFKSFLIENQKKDSMTKKYKSSREFYNFINHIKKKQKRV